jgi:hypothetical protein
VTPSGILFPSFSALLSDNLFFPLILSKSS